jgi:hypothetical protein
MPAYEVMFLYEEYCHVTVQADNETEAEDYAEELIREQEPEKASCGEFVHQTTTRR